MDKNTTLAFIGELSEAPGAPGFEDEAVGCLRRRGEGLGDWEEDSMRNLYLRPGKHKDGLPHLMLDAHTDEVGFMVRAIRPNGTLDFIPLGGWVASNVGAHRVLVRNDLGKWIPGVVSSRPPHFLSEAEKKQAPELSNMVIDVGASGAKELAETYRISIAAPVVPDARFEYRPENDIMIGKAFDNRLGCAALLETVRALAGSELGVNLSAAFAAQEELGVRGATVTAQVLRPDAAVVFEGTPADDTVVEAYAVQTAVKKGPMLRYVDSKMVTNPRFQRFALDLAAKAGIPVQAAVRTGGSTNGGVIHLTGRAVPTIVIGVPVRYIHTHYGIASYGDFENAVKLACEVIRKLDKTVIAGF